MDSSSQAELIGRLHTHIPTSLIEFLPYEWLTKREDVRFEHEDVNVNLGSNKSLKRGEPPRHTPAQRPPLTCRAIINIIESSPDCAVR